MICDFGMATECDDEVTVKQCGTPGYFAPEILEDIPNYNPICPCIDVYSMGIIFYILLTGNMPWSDNKNLLEQNKNSNIDLSVNNRYLRTHHENIRKILCSMLEKSPDNRISAMKAIELLDYVNNKEKNDDLGIEFSIPDALKNQAPIDKRIANLKNKNKADSASQGKRVNTGTIGGLRPKTSNGDTKKSTEMNSTEKKIKGQN